MKILDYISAGILLLLGCTHAAVTFFVFKALVVGAVWFFCGALALIFAAMFNLARIRRPADRLVAALSVIANLMMAGVFVGALPWIVHNDLKANPQVIVAAVAVIIEFLLSLRQWLR